MYNEMLGFVKNILIKNDGEATKINEIPFRKRSEHIKRVYNWAVRLVGKNSKIDREAVLVASIFHDSGYAISIESTEHAKNSAIICRQYLKEHGYKIGRIDFITYLVENHSNKFILENENTPIELVILMEADLLDETGALSIIWDCMMEGNSKDQSFEKTHDHIKRYSGKILDRNPMRTDLGKNTGVKSKK
jgi:uncharacterized protein